MKTLLIIGLVWPEPNSSAAGSRMLQLISFFKTNGYKITFASACGNSDHAFDIESLGVVQQRIKLNDTSFNDFIHKLQPELVLFDRFITEEQFGWRVSEQLPDAVKILDTEDLHFLRKAREVAVKSKKELTDEILFNDTAKREIASIYRCDLSLIISTAEMSLLKSRFNISDNLLFYFPFLFEPTSFDEKQKLPNFSQRHHFISIGNFIHPPNYDALLVLKKKIWPLIRKTIPNAEIHNYGAYASQKVTQLHDEKSGFLIKGRAKDAREVIQNSKVLLAPLRFGAGLKGKLFDAMLTGTPYVSSSIGEEGILHALASKTKLKIDVKRFANQAIELYQNENLWNKKQLDGYAVLETQFNKSKFENLFIKRLNNLKDHLNIERQNNFIGQMLEHHTLQSTKYLSKWIEAKQS